MPVATQRIVSGLRMALSTNQKPTIYRNLYENTGPGQSMSTLTLSNFVLCTSSIIVLPIFTFAKLQLAFI